MKTGYEKGFRNVCWGVVAAILFMGPVWAQPSEVGRMNVKERQEHGKKFFAEISEKLKLTQDQKSKLDANREKSHKEFEAIREATASKQKELSAALEAATLDMNTVNKIHGELKALIMKKEDQRLAAILEVRQILTPEQFAQFQKMALEKKEEYRDAAGRGKGKGKRNKKEE